VSRAIAEFVHRRRALLVTIILAGAVVLAPRANITRIDNDLTAWFSREDPVYQQYQRFQDEFGGTRTLIIAIEAPSRDRLLSAEGFAYLDRVSGDIERVEAVDRVSSLATATVVDAAPGPAGGPDAELRVRKLVRDLDTMSPADVGRRALDDELLRGDLISADGTVAAIVVFFDERRIDDIRGEVIERIRGIVRRALPAGFREHINGSLEISETYNRITLENQTKFTPPIMLLTFIAIYAMFRSWRYTLLTMGAVLVSVIWTLGLYNLFGFTYNVLSSMIVPLVIVLAISDDVHILQHYGEARRRGTPEEAFKSTVAHLVAPLLGASGTTALGMASLAMSSVVAVREFGLGSAVGVMVDFAISIVLMPTALGWMKPEPAPPPQQAWFENPMRAVAAFTVRRARVVMIAAVAITVVSAAGLLRLRVDTNHINFFSSTHPLGSSAAVIDSRLAGIYSFQVFLEGPPDSLKQPDALKRMDRLEAELRTLPFVRKVTGLVDYVKRVHREIGDDRTATVPDDPFLVAQELFVFALGDDGRVELERVATSDFSRAQITVNLASMSSDLVFEQVEKAEAIAAEIFAGSGIRPAVTGSGRLFATLDHYLVTSQIGSFSTAFVTVFAVIFLIFRSWRFGLLAIVPNLFPVLAVFGVMGWLDISLNIATVMLASVALGVVDDDTIHFISRYRKETARGAGTADAIALATAHEGRAALTTAVINSCSFAVLALSEYRPTAWFGGLLALTMIVAFLAEIFVLPATITLVPRLFSADAVHRATLARLRTKGTTT
jgi:predicted RND superfamily exporter protein